MIFFYLIFELFKIERPAGQIFDRRLNFNWRGNRADAFLTKKWLLMTPKSIYSGKIAGIESVPEAWKKEALSLFSARVDWDCLDSLLASHSWFRKKEWMLEAQLALQNDFLKPKIKYLRVDFSVRYSLFWNTRKNAIVSLTNTDKRQEFREGLVFLFLIQI